MDLSFPGGFASVSVLFTCEWVVLDLFGLLCRCSFREVLWIRGINGGSICWRMVSWKVPWLYFARDDCNLVIDVCAIILVRTYGHLDDVASKRESFLTHTTRF